MESEKEVLQIIGQRLRKLRIEKGFSSYEHFAIEHDISRMHYWQIEKGKVNITIRTLLNILSKHDISIDDFFRIKLIEGDNNSQK